MIKLLVHFYNVQQLVCNSLVQQARKIYQGLSAELLLVSAESEALGCEDSCGADTLLLQANERAVPY